MDDAGDRSSAPRILAALRRARPAAVVARFPDGTERPLALKKGRGRWEAATRVLGPWLEDGAVIELRDLKGGVLALIEDERDDVQEDDEHRRAGARDERMLNLLLRAQDTALRRHHDLLGTLLTAQASMVRELSSRVAELERSYIKSLRVQAEAIIATAEAEAAAAGRDDSPLAALAGAVLSRHPAAARMLAGVSGVAEPPTEAAGNGASGAD